MKIEISKISPEGVKIQELVDARALEVDTDTCAVRGPIKLSGTIYKITNSVTADLVIQAAIISSCSRCLNECEFSFSKEVRLSYPVTRSDLVVDMGPDIREEVMLGFPLQPLCSSECKGLCARCGRNLNEGKCNCSR
ncbi:MAG: DUF177 domain-containing protein [Candidatus Omnitrophica bacterium]|nr:DUF177 domain-containing protein [Candidatus Omnitrophota bacterium]